MVPPFVYGTFTLYGLISHVNSTKRYFLYRRSATPKCTLFGLGSSAFARRYLRNRSFFLFLALLRCFSSGGSLRMAMYLPYDNGGLLRWVSPFRDLRIVRYLPLPAAYRSLSRLSSAPSAKAFALCSSSLDLPFISIALLIKAFRSIHCQ